MASYTLASAKAQSNTYFQGVEEASARKRKAGLVSILVDCSATVVSCRTPRPASAALAPQGRGGNTAVNKNAYEASLSLLGWGLLDFLEVMSICAFALASV